MKDRREPGSVTLQIGAGEPQTISWPPANEREWEILSDYFRKQDEVLHKMRRAIVSLEKKVHWGIPTQAVLRRLCVYLCKDEDGNFVDPTTSKPEGDGSGVSDNGGAQDEDVQWV